jgi:hypothetical protein
VRAREVGYFGHPGETRGFIRTTIACTLSRGRIA